MRLTRRGRGVGVLVVSFFVWGTTFGIDSMNVLVVSGIVALLGSGIILYRAEEPTFHRNRVGADFAGQPRIVSFEVSVPSPLVATVIDPVPAAIDRVDEERTQIVRNGRAEYSILPERRGLYTLGPATIEVTDPLGLVKDRVQTTAVETVLVYPKVRSLKSQYLQHHSLLEGAVTPDRHEFDRLREYERGDAVRDIDWKSSAKRSADPLVVKEFVTDTDAGAAEIVATSEHNGEDAMATAAASLAIHLLESGMTVGLQTSDERVYPDSGAHHRHELLAALARTSGGWFETGGSEAETISLEADESGHVTVRTGTAAREFGEMLASTDTVALADGGVRG